MADPKLIFVSANGSNNALLDTLSVHLTSIITTKFEQPMLGSNYLALDIKPSSEGGLTEGTHAELRSKNEPLFQFVSVFDKTRERAVYMRRQAQMEDQETLRMIFSLACWKPINFFNTAAYAIPSTSGATGSNTPQEAPPGYDE